MVQHLRIKSWINKSSNILSLLALASVASAASGPSKEVVTNQFHVLIKRDASHDNPHELASQIARENGFHNLGPVSIELLMCT